MLLAIAANSVLFFKRSRYTLKYGGGGRSGLESLSLEIEKGSDSESASLKVGVSFSCPSSPVPFERGILQW